MITVSQLIKSFEGSQQPVLDGISFAVDAGDTLSVIGPSGCGKTTLLYILAGLLRPTAGSVQVAGAQTVGGSGRTAFILQNFGLFPWKTVYENVALGLVIHRVDKAKIHRKIVPILEELDIASLAGRYPVQLSGGQQQRVAIARALATDPDILLMDEPFSALDAMTREHLQNLLLQLWHRRRLTYIIVTHSVEEAVFLGTTVMVLGDRPTRIKRVVSNRGFGSSDYRMHNDYFNQVKRIRLEIEV